MATVVPRGSGCLTFSRDSMLSFMRGTGTTLLWGEVNLYFTLEFGCIPSPGSDLLSHLLVKCSHFISWEPGLSFLQELSSWPRFLSDD